MLNRIDLPGRSKNLRFFLAPKLRPSVSVAPRGKVSVEFARLTIKIAGNRSGFKRMDLKTQTHFLKLSFYRKELTFSFPAGFPKVALFGSGVTRYYWNH